MISTRPPLTTPKSRTFHLEVECEAFSIFTRRRFKKREKTNRVEAAANWVKKYRRWRPSSTDRLWNDARKMFLAGYTTAGLVMTSVCCWPCAPCCVFLLIFSQFLYLYLCGCNQNIGIDRTWANENQTLAGPSRFRSDCSIISEPRYLTVALFTHAHASFIRVYGIYAKWVATLRYCYIYFHPEFN